MVRKAHSWAELIKGAFCLITLAAAAGAGVAAYQASSEATLPAVVANADRDFPPLPPVHTEIAYAYSQGKPTIVWRDYQALAEAEKLEASGDMVAHPHSTDDLIACRVANGTKMTSHAGDASTMVVMIASGENEGCGGVVLRHFALSAP